MTVAKAFILNSLWPIVTCNLFIKATCWNFQWSLLVSLHMWRKMNLSQFSAMNNNTVRDYTCHYAARYSEWWFQISDGSKGAHPACPPQVPIFSFWHTNFTKCIRSGSLRPATGIPGSVTAMERKPSVMQLPLTVVQHRKLFGINV